MGHPEPQTQTDESGEGEEGESQVGSGIDLAVREVRIIGGKRLPDRLLLREADDQGDHAQGRAGIHELHRRQHRWRSARPLRWWRQCGGTTRISPRVRHDLRPPFDEHRSMNTPVDHTGPPPRPSVPRRISQGGRTCRTAQTRPGRRWAFCPPHHAWGRNA